MLILLVGYMGSGKTTFGKELSHALNYAFLDMDELLVKGLGMSVEDCFEIHGEEVFRYAEHELLKSILDEKDSVVATGGGTPCFYDNMEIMNRKGMTVYLKVEEEELYQRLKDNAGIRPLLRNVIPGELKEFISSHLEERERSYLKAEVILTERTPLQDLVDKILNKTP